MTERDRRHQLSAIPMPVLPPDGVDTRSCDDTAAGRLPSAMDLSPHSTMDTWWQHLWTASPVAIALLGEDRRYQAANPAFCRLLGVDEDGLKSWPYERITHADDLDAELDAVVRLAAGAPSASYRRRYLTVHGTDVTASVQLCPGPAGGTLQFVTPDSSPVAPASTTRAWTSLAEIGAALSHDAQEPARMISSHLSVLAERLPADLDPRLRAGLDTSIAASLRLRRQLRGLVQYARLGKPIIDDVPVALDHILATALEEGFVAPPAIQVTADIALHCDRGQVALALRHLLANAVAFALPGTPPAVHVSTALVGSVPTLSVSDQGRGIAAADQPRLFRLLATLGRSDEYGAGVGLALCRAVAEGHGGRAWLDSQPDRGTTVHLSFPLG